MVRKYPTGNFNQKFLSIHVDEGRLGKIVFKNASAIESINFRRQFDLPENIWHSRKVKKELKKLKENNRLRFIKPRLIKRKKFTEDVFQLDNEFDFNQIGDGGYRKHYYLMAGYNIAASYDLIVTPTLLLKSSFTNKGTQFEVGGIATYQEDMWGGLNFRQGEAISVLLGKSFMKDKQMKLGYSIDFTVKGNAAKNLTSHEIMLSYALPSALVNTRPIIRTPRFRY